MPWFASLLLQENTDQMESGQGKGLFGTAHFEGSQGRNVKAGTTEVTEECSFLAHFPNHPHFVFLSIPGPPAQGLERPTVGWVLPPQSQSKKMPPRSDPKTKAMKANVSPEDLLPQMTVVNIKLPENNQDERNSKNKI